MLKMTEIELDLTSDINMYLFIEKGMRGGISYIAKRHSKANNKYMKYYYSSKESKYIIYLDANNLYGWAMIQYLPYSGFKWLNQKEISDFCLNSISENSSIGYILEVDFKNPSELHDLHNDYPLAPEKLEITQNMLSKYCPDIANKYGIKIGGVNKLFPNLRIKKYIDFNTDKRKNAANSFEKDFFKLMNNSVFGKTMENLRKRISAKLVNNSKDYVRCISKSIFISQKIFSKHFVAIHEIKPVLILNKRIYIGFSILDLSKLLMYEFHYKDIKSKSVAKLLFTDTDSVVFQTKIEDVYEYFYRNNNVFYFSNYPLDSRFFDPANKNVIGKMKDEFKGKKNQ